MSFLLHVKHVAILQAITTPPAGWTVATAEAHFRTIITSSMVYSVCKNILNASAIEAIITECLDDFYVR